MNRQMRHTAGRTLHRGNGAGAQEPSEAPPRQDDKLLLGHFDFEDKGLDANLEVNITDTYAAIHLEKRKGEAREQSKSAGRAERQRDKVEPSLGRDTLAQVEVTIPLFS